MSIIVIENDDLRVGVAVHYGARVVNLVDKRSGREWMTQGADSPDTHEDVPYLGAEAVGWDECFPTVGRWDGAGTPWGRNLRDHGDLWGRPWRLEAQDATSMTTSFEGAEFLFARTLRLEGPTLRVDYRVTNRLDEPLPYLWALHALFAADEGDRIELPVSRVHGSFIPGRPSGPLDWPETHGVLPFPLDQVQPSSAGFMGKMLAHGLHEARLGRPGNWLELRWEAPTQDLGIWLTYGGWFGHQEVALEPQSAAADDLGQAIAAGAKPLAPGETRDWSVSLMVTA